MGGRGSDLLLITALTLPTYGQERSRHSDPVMWAPVQKLSKKRGKERKRKAALLRAFLSTTDKLYSDARSQPETSLQI